MAMQVTLLLPTHKQSPVEVSLDSSVDDLQRKAADLTETAPNCIELVYGDQKLGKDLAIADSGLVAGAEVVVKRRVLTPEEREKCLKVLNTQLPSKKHHCARITFRLSDIERQTGIPPIDRDVVMRGVSMHGSELQHVGDEFRSDRDVVLAAVYSSGGALEYAHPSLRGDKELVLVAVDQRPQSLEHASEELRDDEEVVRAAHLEYYPNVMAHASSRLRGSKSFVLEMCALNGDVLRHVSEDLRGDKEVVLTAVRNKQCAVKWASPELQEDPEVLQAAKDPES